MSVCSVCGEKVNNLSSGIVRGKSGEWVCKKCLKKANIGVMQFSCQNITSGQIIAIINGNTMNSVNGQITAQNNSAGMCCPRCRSNDLQIISDVRGKGASFWKLCFCGWLGLSGSGKTTTTHYWVCKKCGNKFKV